MTPNVKVVKQKDLKDCGAACLLSVIRFYGGNVPLEKIRLDTHTTKEGTTAFNIITASKKYGFDSAGYKLNLTDLKECTLPVIAHVIINNMEHFIVIYKISKQKLLIMDPVKGKTEISFTEFNEIWDQVILVLIPKQQIIYINASDTLLLTLFKFLKQNRGLLLKIFLTSLILTIISVVCSFYFKVGIDFLTNNLNKIITIFALLLIFKCTFKYLRSYFENYLNKNLDVTLMKEFLSHLFSLPNDAIQSRSVGEIMTRVNEISNIKNIFTEIFISFFLDFTLTLVTIPILIILNKTIFLILCIFLILYLLLGIIFSKIIYRRVMQNIDYESDFNTVLIENITCFNSIKNLNITEKILDKIENKICTYIYDNFNFSKHLNIQESLKDSLSEICFFIINSLGFYLILNNKLSLVDLILFNSLVNYFIDPIKNLINSLPKYNFLKASYDKIKEFMTIEKENVDNKLIKIPKYNIEIKNLCYSYNDFTQILSNINLNIIENEHVILKGKSGCGKSTLCKIISASVKNYRGNITLGNINYQDLNQKSLKNNITYISQYENLYSDTIKNNILFYRETDIEKFNLICSICEVEEIVNKKPLRYETFINMDSNNLSGGEKQRIILARACLNDFKILIIDEALSEVDYELEKRIISKLRNYFKNKTIIYVSHKSLEHEFSRIIEIGA